MGNLMYVLSTFGTFLAVMISLYLGLKPKTKAKITVSAVINKVDYYIENNPGGNENKVKSCSRKQRGTRGNH